MYKNFYPLVAMLLTLVLFTSACGAAATLASATEEPTKAQLTEESTANTSSGGDTTPTEGGINSTDTRPADVQPSEEPPPGPSQNAPLVTANATQVLTGYLDIGYGDPPEDSGLPALITATLTKDNQLIAVLEIEYNPALQFQGHLVEVTGEFYVPEGKKEPRFRVQNIQDVIIIESTPSITASAALTGSQPWVMVLCRFNGDAFEPHDQAWYTNLFGTAYPGLNHYWQQLSYGNINLDGTQVTQWYELPEPRTGYIDGDGNAMLTKLAVDCATAADDDVNFPDFVGIHFSFNDSLDCCAWGGNRSLTFDGVTQNYRTTWFPPWGQSHHVIAHEMGHGFGFPHSTGPHDNPPSGLSVYVSQWDVMSRSGGTCAAADTTNFGGCLGQGTIAYHLGIDSWVPGGREASVADGNLQIFTVGQLYPLQADGSMLLIKVPINDSTTNFYTVELRRHASLGEDIYDQNIPDTAVLIHKVDTSRSGQDGQGMVVDDVADGNDNVNDAGSRWVAGETFLDTTNNILIAVRELNLQNPAVTAQVCVVNNATESTPPVTAATPSGTLGNAGWWVSPVTVALSATDDCTGVQTIFYQIDGGTIQSIPGSNGSLIVTTDGTHNINYWAQDYAGNIETSNTLTLAIDATAPVVYILTDKPQYTRSELITFSLSAIEADPPLGSGLASLSAELTTPNGAIPISDGTVVDPFLFNLGVYNFTAQAEDVAGNISSDAGSFELIATLESLLPTLQKLCADGEISKPGICKSLEAKLSAANNAHDRGNFNAMINELNAFLHELSAQKGKIVSQEAFDLLQQDVSSIIEQFGGVPAVATSELL